MEPRRAFQFKIVLGVLMMLASYCAASGRIDLWPGWCFAAFFLMALSAGYFVLNRVAPDLMVERVSWGAGVLSADKPIVFWLMFAPMLHVLPPASTYAGTVSMPGFFRLPPAMCWLSAGRPSPMRRWR
jgi:hypothetical protein